MDYKKLYAFLVAQIDAALSILDTGNLLEFDHVKEILSGALLEAEKQVIDFKDENNSIE